MVKIWFRSRKYQVILVVLIPLILTYCAFTRNQNQTIENLDLTRSLDGDEFTRLRDYYVVNVRVPRWLRHNTWHSYKDVEYVREYIEKKIEEALIEDKGMGCEMPKLDPFSNQMMKFETELKHIECKGQDWVKCYLSECRVRKEILETTKNIECQYRDILYMNDQRYTIGPPTHVKGGDVYKLVKSDHVKISCTGKYMNNTMPTLKTKNFLSSKWLGHGAGFRSTAKAKPAPKGREGTLNVLILGFDSTARNGFIRRMPKSYRVLKDELQATLLKSYNVVGDGTPASIFPILTGKNELELPECRKSMKGSGHLDSMPFVFYKLKQDGYRTAYFEDMPWIGTFQYRFNGFLKQPSDHYLRSFFLEESNTGRKWSLGGTSRYCVGDTPQYKLMLDLTEQFFKLDGKRYAFTFIADITHDDFNMIAAADDDVVNFLRTFKKQGHLKDTLLIVMGDHGPRYSNVRNTMQGRFEERLPLMAIVLPEKLKVDRPDALSFLKSNVDVLTTPHDIYATIMDAVDMTELWNPYKVKGADLTRGLTLLETIPRNRSCSEAGIEPHWCACTNWRPVLSKDPMYKRVPEALVRYINELTQFVRVKCQLRMLKMVSWVMKQHVNTKMLQFKGARDADGYVGNFDTKVKRETETYQVKITVGPGNGIFEAVVTHFVLNDTLYVSANEISRVNAYNTEPSCISNVYPHLNKYCYCND